MAVATNSSKILFVLVTLILPPMGLRMNLWLKDRAWLELVGANLPR
jgi:hypothetical protein